MAVKGEDRTRSISLLLEGLQKIGGSHASSGCSSGRGHRTALVGDRNYLVCGRPGIHERLVTAVLLCTVLGLHLVLSDVLGPFHLGSEVDKES